MKEMCFALLYHKFPIDFVACTWEEGENEGKAKPKTKPKKTQSNHIILVLS